MTNREVEHTLEEDLEKHSLRNKKRVIAERERKLKKTVDRIKKQREHVRDHRHKRHLQW